jgi:hypothetical protein
MYPYIRMVISNQTMLLPVVPAFMQSEGSTTCPAKLYWGA